VIGKVCPRGQDVAGLIRYLYGPGRREEVTILCICFVIRVDRADPGHLTGPVGQAQHGHGGDGQGDPAGEPGRDHPGHRPGRRRGGGLARPGRPGPARAGPAVPVPAITVPAVSVLTGPAATVRAAALGPGVGAEQDIHESPGPQLVHVLVQPGLAQLFGPRGHPLVGGQHLGRGQFPPGQPRVPGALEPPLYAGPAGPRVPAAPLPCRG